MNIGSIGLGRLEDFAPLAKKYYMNPDYRPFLRTQFQPKDHVVFFIFDSLDQWLDYMISQKVPELKVYILPTIHDHTTCKNSSSNPCTMTNLDDTIIQMTQSCGPNQILFILAYQQLKDNVLYMISKLAYIATLNPEYIIGQKTKNLLV